VAAQTVVGFNRNVWLLAQQHVPLALVIGALFLGNAQREDAQRPPPRRQLLLCGGDN